MSPPSGAVSIPASPGLADCAWGAGAAAPPAQRCGAPTAGRHAAAPRGRCPELVLTRCGLCAPPAGANAEARCGCLIKTVFRRGEAEWHRAGAAPAKKCTTLSVHYYRARHVGVE